jgi:hypothetical protein
MLVPDSDYNNDEAMSMFYGGSVWIGTQLSM